MKKSKTNTYKMKVDDVGRVTIPIEIRRQLGIEPFDYVEATCDGMSVIYQKEDATELDVKICSLLMAAKDNYKLTNTDYDVLKEILGKLRS